MSFATARAMTLLIECGGCFSDTKGQLLFRISAVESVVSSLLAGASGSTSTVTKTRRAVSKARSALQSKIYFDSEFLNAATILLSFFPNYQNSILQNAMHQHVAICLIRCAANLRLLHQMSFSKLSAVCIWVWGQATRLHGYRSAHLQVRILQKKVLSS